MSSPPPSKDKQGFPRPRREGGGRVGRGERISFQGKEGFPKEPASRTVKLAAAPPENDHRMGKAEKEQIFYGIISTIKQGFGFIQPLLDDEQIFMSARELYVDIKLGDRVGFFVRQSPRGLAAEVVHRIAPNLEKVVENVKGTVSRGTDRHRSGVGTITIDMALLDADVTAQLADLARKEVVFMPADVLPRTVPKNHRLDKGDYVQFSIFRVTGSTLFVAASISFVQLKRDRAVALQIQRMLDAGVKRELGIVSALKNGEYGFIKALDRKDEIYFRMEDGRAQGSSPEDGVDDKLGEGSEIEFFVITEMVKGKMSDRAIHVKVVPKGTVKFELVVAAGVEACVIAESASHPEETPGIARLMLSLSTEVVGSLSEGSSGHLDVIELWQRCLPDEMTCAVGDMLLLDVHFYRPEKLFFARNVKIGQYRRLGREVGTICSLKENGFGFIHSALRSADLYFKYSHVLGWDSLPVAESALKVGAVITFDVSFESTNQGGKLKAKRVMIQKAESKVKEDSRYIMKEDILGAVVRTATKKDSAGLIKIFPGQSLEQAQGMVFYDPDIVEGLASFESCAQWSTVSIYGLPPSALKNYTLTVEANFAGKIAYESSQTDPSDAGQGHTLRVFKVDEAQYADWKSAQKPQIDRNKDSVVTSVQYFKEDYGSPELGPLANDLNVVFHLAWDKQRCRKVAKCVRLTDEAIEGEVEAQTGVIDVVVDKGDKYGFIRSIPTDEKIFWHIASSAASGASGAKSMPMPIMSGSEVQFNIRRRGGLRCATSISTLPAGSLAALQMLPETCVGLVTEPGMMVLLDVSMAPLLRQKYIDTKVLLDATCAKTDSVKELWNKVSMPTDADDKAPAVESVPDSAVRKTETGKSKDVSVASVGNNAPEQVEYKAKYFPPLTRGQIPILQGPEGSFSPQVGDVVSCRLSVQWGLQRSPTYASEIVKHPTLQALKRKGRINRLKFRVKGATSSPYVDEACLSAYNMTTVDFTEIQDSNECAQDRDTIAKLAQPAGAFFNGHYYFCDVREVQSASTDEYSRESSVQIGDEVEFWAVPSLGSVAFAVKQLPKTATNGDHGILFGKRPVAIASDSKPRISPLNLITMAEGPPNDLAAGFPDGWRLRLQADTSEKFIAGTDVSKLPWFDLLQHLS